MNNVFDLTTVINILKRKFYIIIIAIVFCVGLIDGLTYFFVTPVYKASTEVLIEQSQAGEQQLQEDQTSTQLLNTYLVIIKSASITNDVADKMNFQITPKAVSGSLTVENASGSKIISIIAKANSPQKATEIVNRTTEELKTKAPSILKNSSVVVLEEATVENSTNPVAPNFKTTTALGIFGGLFMGIIFLYLGQLLNTKIRTKSDIEDVTKYPFLGKVSKVKK